MAITLRTGFAGTPEFAATALEAMLESGFRPSVVLTQPDRPAGRGMRAQASPVKSLALTQDIAVLQPRSLRLDGRYPQDAAAAHQQLAGLDLDVLVVAAYGLILPSWLLELPRHGCLNIHASLLPRWRGAAPLHRAVEAGDARSGVTIMQMDAGLDTGAMVSVHELDLAADETTASLHDRLAALGGQAIVVALTQLQQCGQRLPARAQPEHGITYAEKVRKSEAALDFTEPAVQVLRRIRAFNPFPGAQARVLHQAHTDGDDGAEEIIKIWAAHEVPPAAVSAGSDLQPGVILQADRASGIVVACGGNSCLCLSELQRAGGRRLQASEFLNGFALRPGDRLALPSPA